MIKRMKNCLEYLYVIVRSHFLRTSAKKSGESPGGIFIKIGIDD